MAVTIFGMAAVPAAAGAAASSSVKPARLCSTPRPGTASCDAIALRLTATGRFYHPPAPAPVAAQERAAHVLSITADSEPGATLEPGAGSPGWLQQAYDTTWLSANRGSGDTIAIVDAYDDPTASSDLATYRSTYGLPACSTGNGCLTILNQNGQTQAQATSWPSADPSWEGEETLDLDAVSAICPNCHIVLVEANSSALSNFAAAEAAAAAYPGVDQISDSWGASGSVPPASAFSFTGITVLAASGDAGYESAGPQYPAAYAGVTAVGGTSLTTGSTSSTRGFTETAWGGAGSSCATHVAQPAWQAGQACAGRATSDLAADADPDTGLLTYGAAVGGWAVFGGTSLSTPLTAAFEAVTQIPGGSTAQWAYTNAGELNDITSGSNDASSLDQGGTCTAALSYLCNAGAGFDGPTGNGSIDGDIVSGGPGIGGPDACAPGSCNQVGAGYATASTASTAQLQAQIDPNGLATSYYWEYGATTSFGQQTPVATLAASSAPATTQTALSGLGSGTTYYYRLVASNADGTVYGYTFSLTTAAAPASNAPAPTSASSGSGSSAPTPTTASSATPPAASIPVTTTATTPPATSGTQAPTASGTTDAPASGGATTSSTGSAAPIALLLSGGRTHATAGDVLTAALPAGAPATAGAVTQLLRCRDGCSPVRTTGARYTLTDADAGALMRVRYTSRWGGRYSSAYVGPVLTATTAGAMLLAAHSASLRTAGGATLASARTVTSARARRLGGTTTVTITRAPHVDGTLRAWICPTALDPQGHPVACSSPVTLGHEATLHMPVGGSFAVVVQR